MGHIGADSARGDGRASYPPRAQFRKIILGENCHCSNMYFIDDQ